MSLITFNNVTKYYSTNLILDHISFAVNLGEKVALIGNNGCGKTTLFKMILGQESATLVPKEDKVGDILITNGTTIGYLDQNCITNINNTVYEELLLVFEKQIKMEKKIEDLSKKISLNPNDSLLLDEYNNLLLEFEKERGYTYKNEIKEYLSRFNFDDSYYNRVISSLSGGERMKVAFIKLLLFKYDVLLLDEPTNHIDVSTIEWLENFLKTYPGTIFFISHDRYFLENLATKIIEIENHKLTTYNMTYDNYLLAKQKNYETLLKQSAKEEEQIEKYKRFIEFYMPKPRFASRAHDREKKLAKLEANRVEVPKAENRKIKFKIEGSNLASKQLIKFFNCVIGYDKPLTPAFDFILYGQDRLAIVGDNGIGKTTLVKSIVGDIPLYSGSIKHLRDLRIGYIKQNDYVFSKNTDAIGYLREKYPTKLDSELRSNLGRFLFKGEDIFKSTGLMSNGEKMRLTLCAFAMSDYDVLVLDEPTNHLDMVTKECLLEALKEYRGCIIFVSHDRYFINELATHILYLTRNDAIFTEGNYDDLKLLLEARENQKEAPKVDYKELEKNLVIEKPIEVKKEKLSNNAIQKLKDEADDIELSLDAIDDKFNDPNTKYSEFASLNEEKSRLETRYYEILGILEDNNN
jgi:ATPase components of ABC transporters with duplicated ATPase domains